MAAGRLVKNAMLKIAMVAWTKVAKVMAIVSDNIWDKIWV